MRSLPITPGTRVRVDGSLGEITRRSGLDRVQVRLDSGKLLDVPISSLKDPNAAKDRASPAIDSFTPEQLEEANRWFGVIQPLLRYRRIPHAEMEKATRSLGVHRTTLQRKLAAYRQQQDITALCARKPNGGRGKSRLPDEIEAIVKSEIEEGYLSKQKLNATEVWKNIEERCSIAKVKPPDINTVRRRIAVISKKQKVKKREGYATARDQFSPLEGNFPDADYPLSIIQLDHTPLDIEVVHDRYRDAIGRPTFTPAIDVYTRMIVGFYLTLESPSVDLVGCCVYRSIMPKDRWLADLGVKGSWPIWGLFDRLHTDNGPEFKSDALKMSLRDLGIEHSFRPKGDPSWGGHIERFIGTINGEMHTLPGTTFSNPIKRGEYKSSKHAVLSLRELEKLIAAFICTKYHKRPHSELGMSPEEKLAEAIETGNIPDATRFQAIPASEEEKTQLRIRLLPTRLVTVQRYGIQIGSLRYQDPVLTRWIKEQNPDREDGRFVVRYDPDGLGEIYFFDPGLKKYLSVGFRNPARPSVSRTEVKQARRAILGKDEKPTEDAIFDYIREKRKIVDEAAEKKRGARREQQRRKGKPADVAVPKAVTKKTSIKPKKDDDDDGPIEPTSSEIF